MNATKLALSFIFTLFMAVAAQASDLFNCGINLDFNSGRIECAALNGPASDGGNAWYLVRHYDGKSWWLDSELGVVWGPTHAYFYNSDPNGSVVAFDFPAAEADCQGLGGEVPTPEDFYAAFNWRYAHFTFNSSMDSVLGPKPVFWAKSKSFKTKMWMVHFDDKGQLERNFTFVPVNGEKYGFDFRCIWRNN